MEDLLEATFTKIKAGSDHKGFIGWNKVFSSSLTLPQKLTRALHLSHLSFQDKLYFTGNGFQIKGIEAK